MKGPEQLTVDKLTDDIGRKSWQWAIGSWRKSEQMTRAI